MTSRLIAAEHRKRAFESGADTYITKPFQQSVLVTTVRTLSERETSGRR